MNFPNNPECLPVHPVETPPKPPHPPEDGRGQVPVVTLTVGWKPVIPAPCFSVATLLSAVDDDRDFAVELLELLLAQTPAEVQAIGQALAGNDFATIGRIIHSQKVSFQVIGLTEVVRLGQAAEALMAANKTGTATALLVTQYARALDAEIPLMRTGLQSLL